MLINVGINIRAPIDHHQVNAQEYRTAMMNILYGVVCCGIIGPLYVDLYMFCKAFSSPLPTHAPIHPHFIADQKETAARMGPLPHFVCTHDA